MALLTLWLASCRNRTEQWQDSLADVRELRAGSLAVVLMKVWPAAGDTASLTYKIRIYPAKQWIEDHTSDQKNGLFYHMDSCFSIRAGKASFNATMVQPVNNGIANCFEYLLLFDIDPAMKNARLSLVYKDKFIDGKPYILNLN